MTTCDKGCLCHAILGTLVGVAEVLKTPLNDLFIVQTLLRRVRCEHVDANVVKSSLRSLKDRLGSVSTAAGTVC